MKALKIIGMVLACVAGAMLFPYLLIILLLWSPVAWILGLIFPGNNFYPINKAWPIINDWVGSKLGISLNSILLIFLAFLILEAAISWIAGLFSNKK